MTPETENKKQQLQNILQEAGKVFVAYSGGVDSNYLLYEAVNTLGRENVKAAFILSEFSTTLDMEHVKEFSQAIGLEPEILKMSPLDSPVVAANPVDRCYHCKHMLFTKLKELAGDYLLCDGSNLDDNDDYRPGKKACRELGVKSPLAEAGLTKAEIRELSKEAGLKSWDKPAFACLASRIPYGTTIDKKALKMVEESEKFLHELGFYQVRVRIHGNLARIECLPEEISKLMEQSAKICNYLEKVGFTYVTIDMKGYRTGSLNETIKP